MPFPAAQISFGGGELSPEVRARIDITKYAVGAETLRNFFVRVAGGVSNRTGTEFVVEVKDSTKVCRLIPFQFNVEQTYALMFQENSMRVIKDGGLVLEASNPITGATQANPVRITSVAHGFDNGDEVFISGVVGMIELNERFFIVSWILAASTAITGATQANPVVITDVGHPYSTGDRVFIEAVGGMTEINDRDFVITVLGANTYELDGEDGTGHTAYTAGGTAKEIDPDDFDLQGEDGTAFTAYVSNGTVSRVFNLVTPYLDAEIFDLDYTQSNDVMTIVHPNHDPRNLNRLADDNWTLTVIISEPELDAPGGVGVIYTGAGTGIQYDYVVTAFNENTGEESVASTKVTVASGDLSNAGDDSTITWNTVTDATQFNIYKSEDGSEFYGFIGSSNTLTFTDRNITPEFNDSPALSIRDPFSGVNDKPSVVEYFQGRRWFASSNDKPTTVFGSVSGNFSNFNVSKAVRDDDSITATLSSKQANAIRHMVPLGQFVIFTSGSEWLLSSSAQSALLTPSSVSFAVQGYWGATKLKPIVIGNAALYATGNEEVDPNNPKFTMVRDIKYTLESDNYMGNELSVLATHLFEERALVDWTFAQVPFSLVWAIRDDGVCLSLTYSAENQIFAWTTHDTAGTFESVTSIREGGEDAVYFIIRRKIGGVFKRFAERLHSRQFTDIRDWFGVDSGLTLDDPKTISGATQADPVVVTATAHLISNGDKVDIEDVLGMTEINDLRFKAANVTANTFELQTDEAVPVDIDGTGFTAYESGGLAREAFDSLTDLDHLEGETVVALAGGNVLRDLTVTNGTIALGAFYSRVHSGLSYISDLKTIDANIADRSGVVYDTKRKADGVVLRLDKSRGGKAGSVEDSLFEIKWREFEEWGRPGDLRTGDIFVQIESRWDFASPIFYRQSDPLPVTILSVIPEIDRGD